MKFNPATLRAWTRFKSIKRGYYSLILIGVLLIVSLLAEVFVNSRALIVAYEGELYFPTYGSPIPGQTFGLEYSYETNYRDLQVRWKSEGSSNWMVLPPVPYNEYENDLRAFKDEEGNTLYPPFPPNLRHKHYLGTDTSGRDVLARLLYGFRYAISFSLLLLIFSYAIGIAIGCWMGYRGGVFDLMMQRAIEILSNIPMLYVVMILASLTVPNFFQLTLIVVALGWMGMTWYMRTATYKEKAREYVLAARAIGTSPIRIIFSHILPNSLAIIITFIPFSVSSGIVTLTSLDYLGYGLPAPTPSWGELLQQGTENFRKAWIVGSVIVAMTLVLTMVTFIGEAVREAYDPKKHTVYK